MTRDKLVESYKAGRRIKSKREVKKRNHKA